MRSDICVLITMEYPYITGEPFLENEITFLTERFSKIYIFPLASSGPQTRKVLGNVIVKPLNNSVTRLRYLKYGLKGIFSSGEIRKDAIFPILSIKALLATLYARGRVNNSYKKICSLLDLELVDDPTSSIIFYSYWFMDQAMLACLLKTRYGHRYKTKAISRAHGYDLYENRNKAHFIPFRNRVFESIDTIFTCSRDGAEYLNNRYPGYKEKIQISYLGTKNHQIQKLLLKNGSCFRIVSCSSLKPIKRVHLIAEALALIKSKGINDIVWSLIGDGPELDRIISIIKKFNLNNQVEIIGRIPNEKVIEFYKTTYCDLFVNVSESEGLPVSIMEVISFGIPVIATDVGGTREIVDNSCGTLLPQDISSRDLASSIEWYYSLDDKMLQKYRINARIKWEKQFNAENNYKNFILSIADK